MIRQPVRRLLLGLLALVLTACSSGNPSGAQSPSIGAPSAASASSESSESEPKIQLVALGDSIPFNSPDDCPGCTGFVNSYAAALEAQLGVDVAIRNESRHDGARTIDILEQIQSDQDLLEMLAAADVIVMSVGFNDQPPFADEHDGCPEPVAESDGMDPVELGAATSRECIDTVVPLIRDQVAEILERVREQAPDAAIGMLTAYDSWRGWPALDSVNRQTLSDLYAAETYWMHEWRDAMCAEAEAAGAACIDVYSAFNGADGTQPAVDFMADDYTHPSQLGNDTIRDLLLDADLVPTN
jgi:lysophospholipase L1-like esterase